MAYFNHAFKKSFLATGANLTGQTITRPNGTTITGVSTNFGYLSTAGVPTYGLNQLSATSVAANGNDFAGYVGWFNPETNLSVAVGSGTGCCPLYLAGSTIYCKDKISPFLGGYQETNKSKVVNPKYVSTIYDVDPCVPTNNVLHVGSTYASLGGGVLTGAITTAGAGYDPAPSTNIVVGTTTVTGTGTGLTLIINISALGVPSVVGIASVGKGYAATDTVTINNGDLTLPVTTAAVYTINTVTAAIDPVIPGTECCKRFLCGETYSLRIDVKGSPALRFLNHNAYYTATAYTGCCPAGSIAPTPVDSTEVMILWANDLLNSPIVSPFFQIAIQDQNGVIWYAPGTDAAFLAAEGADTWDNYVSPGYISGKCAGLIFNGAYVDTKFGDCTFQVSDFYEVQPINLYASEVDLNGDPCEFEGLCVVNECLGSQVQGTGESVLREFILSESYRQNFVATDFRIREITQGNQIVNAVNRNGLYYKVYLLHSVPRFNNPSGTFDNDQYLLEVVFYGGGATLAAQAANAIAAGAPFWAAVQAWLGQAACSVCEVRNFTCNSTCSSVAFPALPAQCGL